MAQATVDNLMMDFTEQANNPNGIPFSSLNNPGGAGSTATPGGGSVLAFDPYTSPYLQPRRVFFTINTFTNLSKKGVLAKAFLDGVEIEGQSNSNGRVTFSLEEARLLNPSRLTLQSGDLKPQKYFLIQSRKDFQNEVSIIEYNDVAEPQNTPIQSTPPAPTPPIDLGGGGGGFGGGGGRDFSLPLNYDNGLYNMGNTEVVDRLRIAEQK